MPRTISAANLAQLEARESRPIILVRIGSTRLSSRPSDITHGGHTWVGGRLSDVGVIEEALSLNARTMEIPIEGTGTDAIGRLWDTVERDDEVEVSIGFLNDSGGLVASATLWWAGRVLSGMLEADGLDQGRAPEQRISVESLFGELDRSGDFEFSPESQARRGHDTDEFFEFARSMVDAKIGWSETVRLNVRPRQTWDARRIRR